jgi:hypothetical protein
MVANNWEQLSELLDEKIGVRYDADKAEQAKAENSRAKFSSFLSQIREEKLASLVLPM